MTAAGTRAPVPGVSQARVLRSEWIKLWSVRSTPVVLASAVVLVAGAGVLASAAVADSMAAGTWDPGGDPFAPRDATAATLYGVQFAQLLTGLLGVLIVAGEHSSGLVRATFSAVPQRLPVLWAKVAVYCLVTFPLMVVTSLGTFLGGRAFFASAGVTVAFTDGPSGSPAVLRAVLLAAPCYLTGVGVLAIALAFLLRNTAAAVSVLYVVMFLLAPLLGLLLPDTTAEAVVPYLPSAAGQAFLKVTGVAGTLGPWPGLLVFVGYLALALAAAAVVVRRRDA